MKAICFPGSIFFSVSSAGFYRCGALAIKTCLQKEATSAPTSFHLEAHFRVHGNEKQRFLEDTFLFFLMLAAVCVCVCVCGWKMMGVVEVLRGNLKTLGDLVLSFHPS